MLLIVSLLCSPVGIDLPVGMIMLFAIANFVSYECEKCDT